MSDTLTPPRERIYGFQPEFSHYPTLGRVIKSALDEAGIVYSDDLIAMLKGSETYQEAVRQARTNAVMVAGDALAQAKARLEEVETPEEVKVTLDQVNADVASVGGDKGIVNG